MIRRSFWIFAALVALIGFFWSPANAQLTTLGAGHRVVSGGGFTPSCAQSTAFLAAATTVTNPTDQARYDVVICGVVTDFGGTLPFDVWYIWAAPDATAALINIANPGTFNGTTHGTVSFTAYQGYTGDGSTFYIDSGLNPFAATSTNCAGSPCFVQNSATVGVYVLNARATGQFWDIGCAVSGCDTGGMLFSPYKLGNIQSNINSTTNIGGSSTSSQGAWNLTRTASIGSAVFLNSSETPFNQAADTSQAPINQNIIFFSFQGGFGNTVDQIAAGWIAKGVGGVGPGTGVDSCKINNRINTYLASLSSPQNVYSNSAC